MSYAQPWQRSSNAPSLALDFDFVHRQQALCRLLKLNRSNEIGEMLIFIFCVWFLESLIEIGYSLFTVDDVDVVGIETEFASPTIADVVPLCWLPSRLLTLFAALLLLFVSVLLLLLSPFKLLSDTVQGNGVVDFYRKMEEVQIIMKNFDHNIGLSLDFIFYWIFEFIYFSHILPILSALSTFYLH